MQIDFTLAFSRVHGQQNYWLPVAARVGSQNFAYQDLHDRKTRVLFVHVLVLYLEHLLGSALNYSDCWWWKEDLALSTYHDIGSGGAKGKTRPKKYNEFYTFLLQAISHAQFESDVWNDLTPLITREGQKLKTTASGAIALRQMRFYKVDSDKPCSCVELVNLAAELAEDKDKDKCSAKIFDSLKSIADTLQPDVIVRNGGAIFWEALALRLMCLSPRLLKHAVSPSSMIAASHLDNLPEILRGHSPSYSVAIASLQLHERMVKYLSLLLQRAKTPDEFRSICASAANTGHDIIVDDGDMPLAQQIAIVKHVLQLAQDFAAGSTRPANSPYPGSINRGAVELHVHDAEQAVLYCGPESALLPQDASLQTLIRVLSQKLSRSKSSNAVQWRIVSPLSTLTEDQIGSDLVYAFYAAFPQLHVPEPSDSIIRIAHCAQTNSIPHPCKHFSGRRRKLEVQHIVESTELCAYALVALHGIGGIGKTEAARKLAHELCIDNRYSAAIEVNGRAHNVSSEPLNTTEVARKCLEALGVEEAILDHRLVQARALDSVVSEEAVFLDFLHEKMDSNPILLLLDNVQWNPNRGTQFSKQAADPRRFMPKRGSPSRLIITSRDEPQEQDSRISVEHMPVWAEEDIEDYLQARGVAPADRQQTALQTLWKVSAGLPLLVHMTVAFCESRVPRLPLDAMTHRLSKILTDNMDTESRVRVLLRFFVDETGDAQRMIDAAEFPMHFDSGACANIWDGNTSAADSAASLRRLHSAGLLQAEQRQCGIGTPVFRLHDYVRGSLQRMQDSKERKTLLLLAKGWHYCGLLSVVNDLVTADPDENAWIASDSQIRVAVKRSGISLYSLGVDVFEAEELSIRQTWLGCCEQVFGEQEFASWWEHQEHSLDGPEALPLMPIRSDSPFAALLSTMALAGPRVCDLLMGAHFRLRMSKIGLLVSRQATAHNDIISALHMNTVGLAHRHLANRQAAREWFAAAENSLRLHSRHPRLSQKALACALGNKGNIQAEDLTDLRHASSRDAQAIDARIEECLASHSEALEHSCATGDNLGRGQDLGNLAIIYQARWDEHGLDEDRTRAIKYYESRVEVAQQVSDRRGEGNGFGNLATLWTLIGLKESSPKRRAKARASAMRFFEDAIKAHEDIGNTRGVAACNGNKGRALSLLGDNGRNECEEAVTLHERCAGLFEREGDAGGQYVALMNAAIVSKALRKAQTMLAYLQRADRVKESHSTIQFPRFDLSLKSEYILGEQRPHFADKYGKLTSLCVDDLMALGDTQTASRLDRVRRNIIAGLEIELR